MRRAALWWLGGWASMSSGCAYVTRAEFDTFWDADGDGYGIDEDCDADNPAVFPGAGDVRGDGCDADCGFEPDADGDDWPDANDCDPDDATVYPCSPAEIDGDGRDNDCDGDDGVRADVCPTADPYVPDAAAGVCGGRA